MKTITSYEKEIATNLIKNHRDKLNPFNYRSIERILSEVNEKRISRKLHDRLEKLRKEF